MISAVLTIDDVPSKNTRPIVDYLESRGIKAILFAYGKRLERLPENGVYALQHGMILGNHSYAHPGFSKISFEEGRREIEKCEELLDRVYREAGVERCFRPFRFPYGDKGGENKVALQKYLRENQFNKVEDTQIAFPWWKEQGMDRDIDTLWTFDFAEYRIRPDSGFTMEDVWKRVYDPAPQSGGPILKDGSNHIILMHAHDETEEMIPGLLCIPCSVHCQGDLRQIAVHHKFCSVAVPVHKFLTAQMQHGFGPQPGLIGIESIILVNHLCNEAECKWGMHSVTTTMTDSHQPYERICQHLHSDYKVNLILLNKVI